MALYAKPMQVAAHSYFSSRRTVTLKYKYQFSCSIFVYYPAIHRGGGSGGGLMITPYSDQETK